MPKFTCPQCRLSFPMRKEDFPLRCHCGYVATDFESGWKASGRKSQQSSELTPQDLPCIHRSANPVATIACELCGGRTRMVPVYQCKLLGECTLSRAKSGRRNAPACCLGCDQRQAETLSNRNESGAVAAGQVLATLAATLVGLCEAIPKAA